MLIALIKGKLSRDQENMEDILTSNVFGLMKYLPPNHALIPFLKHVENLKGDKPLTNLSPEATANYEFWPMIEEPDCIKCEPDFVIRIHDENVKYLLFIEAKYLSGKSSEEDYSVEEPYDQLAREWDNLVNMAKRENAKPLLIYVTADIGIPRQDIEASKQEYFSKRKNHIDKLDFNCAWISWRKLTTIFRDSTLPALQDLCEMASRLGLCYFESIPPLDLRSLSSWNFKKDESKFYWELPKKIEPIWRFHL